MEYRSNWISISQVEKNLETEIENMGGVDVTSPRQRKKGTTMWELPTGYRVAEHSSGYIRVYGHKNWRGVRNMWPINTRNPDFSWRGSNLSCVLIPARVNRLSRLVRYVHKHMLRYLDELLEKSEKTIAGLSIANFGSNVYLFIPKDQWDLKRFHDLKNAIHHALENDSEISQELIEEYNDHLYKEGI